MKKILVMVLLSCFIISCNVKEEKNVLKSAEEYYEIATKEFSAQNYVQAKENFYELITKYPDSDLKIKAEGYIEEISKIDKEQIAEILKDISSKIESVKTALEKEELLQKIEKQYRYDYLYKDYPDIKDYISKVREQIKNKLSKNIVKDISAQVKKCKNAIETKNLLDHIKNIYKNSYLYEENSDVEKYIDKTLEGIKDKVSKEIIKDISAQVKKCKNAREAEALLEDIEKKYENSENSDVQKYIYKTKEEIQAKLAEEQILEELEIEFADFKTGWDFNSYWSYPMIIMKIKNIGTRPITNLKVNVSFELNNERLEDRWGYFVHSGQVPLQPGYIKTVNIKCFDYRVDYTKFTNVIAHIYIDVNRETGLKSFASEYKFIKTVKIRPTILKEN